MRGEGRRPGGGAAEAGGARRFTRGRKRQRADGGGVRKTGGGRGGGAARRRGGDPGVWGAPQTAWGRRVRLEESRVGAGVRGLPLQLQGHLGVGGAVRGLQMEVVIGKPGDAAAPGGSGQKADLHEVRLVNILQGHTFLPDGGG